MHNNDANMEGIKMTLENMKKALTKRGYAAAIVDLGMSSAGEHVRIVRVEHDYYGPYPDDNAWNTWNFCREYARKHGMRAERRGMTQSTWIYEGGC